MINQKANTETHQEKIERFVKQLIQDTWSRTILWDDMTAHIPGGAVHLDISCDSDLVSGVFYELFVEIDGVFDTFRLVDVPQHLLLQLADTIDEVDNNEQKLKELQLFSFIDDYLDGGR